MADVTTDPLTGEPWVDNVVRRREFEAANPDVTISFEKQIAGRGLWGRWTGVMVVGDEERTVSARDLGALLSKLEPLAADRAAARGPDDGHTKP